MKMTKVLICSIFRNAERNLEAYYTQLKEALKECSNIEFYYSAYENDSTDRTVDILHSLDWKSVFEGRYNIITENINTKFYGSSTDAERVQNLAAARNISLLAKNFYKEVDYVLVVEDDITYNKDTISKLLNFQEYHSISNVDIVSGASVQFNSAQFICRDIWATRRNEREEWGSFLPDAHNTPYGKYWSTFNGLILYKAKPFQEGVKWSAWNSRLNKWDCDTAVICEDFRKHGYSDIFIDHTSVITHWKQGIT